MKTLINKNNPQIRISAPLITFEGDCFYLWTEDEVYTEFWKGHWALVDEEPEKQTSKYLKEPDYDKQVVGKMSKELAKIITDQIVEPVDLDNHTIMEEIRKCGCHPTEFDVARHFYELGLKARKEKQL